MKRKPLAVLAEVEEEIKRSGKARVITPRTLLGWFGYQRRTAGNASIVDECLAQVGLITRPYWREAWIDAEVELELFPVSTKPAPSTEPESGEGIPTTFDPTYRLGRLRAANNPPVSVLPQQSTKEALTIMMAHDFSQLPVMSGERSVRGVISFASIAKRTILGAKCDVVQDCIESAHVVSGETFLFNAINDIISHQYVLVEGPDKKITGIVTTSDLSLEFRQLAEPFLLLGQIEQHIRTLIDRGHFTATELKDLHAAEPGARPVSKVSDLAFGDYVRLLENPAHWQRLQLQLDRAEFIKPLERIRQIRNEVMHFDPDPLEEKDLGLLRTFVGFLQNLQQILRTDARSF